MNFIKQLKKTINRFKPCFNKGYCSACGEKLSEKLVTTAEEIFSNKVCLNPKCHYYFNK